MNTAFPCCRPALAALALFAATAFATTTGLAQGLGGMLNQAKAKVSQAVPQTAPNTSGELPPENNADLTVDSQQRYAHAVLANTRPWVNGQDTGAPDYFYRQLRREFRAPTTFGWDAGAVRFLTAKNRSLWDTCEDIATQLARSAAPSGTQRAALLGALRKVKEIRLSTTPATPTGDDREYGYIKSFDPATGVLTAAIAVGPNANQSYPLGVGVSGTNFTDWIIKHVK